MFKQEAAEKQPLLSEKVKKNIKSEDISHSFHTDIV